jgi:hypothetical protein
MQPAPLLPEPALASAAQTQREARPVVALALLGKLVPVVALALLGKLVPAASHIPAVALLGCTVPVGTQVLAALLGRSVPVALAGTLVPVAPSAGMQAPGAPFDRPVLVALTGTMVPVVVLGIGTVAQAPSLAVRQTQASWALDLPLAALEAQSTLQAFQPLAAAAKLVMAPSLVRWQARQAAQMASAPACSRLASLEQSLAPPGTAGLLTLLVATSPCLVAVSVSACGHCFLLTPYRAPPQPRVCHAAAGSRQRLLFSSLVACRPL